MSSPTPPVWKTDRLTELTEKELSVEFMNAFKQSDAEGLYLITQERKRRRMVKKHGENWWGDL